MKKPEHICKHENLPRYRKYLKKYLSRLRRRLWNVKGEDAPIKKLTRGWSI